MSHKVHIQIDKDGVFKNINCAAAYYGFQHKGYEINLYCDLPKLEPEDVFHGTLPMVQKALESIGIPFPGALETPECLYPFLGRELSYNTLGEVHQSYFDAEQGGEYFIPVHIKPRGVAKLFTGCVIREFKDLLETSAYERSIPVTVSGVVNFISEYRCFVLRNKVIGASRYKGDFTLAPNWNVVQRAVETFSDDPTVPVAYSIDFGITDMGETLLIELNQAFSLGSYGLNSIYYADMIEARWNELTQNLK